MARMARRYERAIKEHNDPVAMVQLAHMMLSPGHGIEPDPSRSVQLYERAIKQGNNVEAMAALGRYLHRGDNPAKRRRGISLLERACTRVEDPDTLQCLAWALLYPNCSVKRQPVRAVHLLRRALRLGEHVGCMRLLSRMLLTCPEVPPDTAYAMRLFKRVAVITKNGDDMYRIGCLYNTGSARVPVDKRRAVKWFGRAFQVTDHLGAKLDFAIAIVYNPDIIPTDPQLALPLLIEVVAKDPSQEAILVMTDLLCCWWETRDFAFGASLSDFAIRNFNCVVSMYRLATILSINASRVPLNIPYALDLFDRHYRLLRPRNKVGLARCIEILSYGINGFPANRESAREHLTTYQSSSQDENGQPPSRESQIFLSRLLRVGVQDVIEADRKRSYELLRSCGDAGDRDVSMLHAMFLSEQSDGDCDVEMNYSKAANLMCSRYQQKEKDVYVWAPLSLRLCSIPLPIQGNPSTLTLCVKRYELEHRLSGLNLAGLRLEHQTLETRKLGRVVLEELLDTSVGDLAGINLGYSWWHGIINGAENRKKGLKMYEHAFAVRPGAIAGALLAGALTNDTGGMVADLERAVQLWRWVRLVCKRDGAELDEFERVCRVLSEDVVKYLEDTSERFEAEGKSVMEFVAEEEPNCAHYGLDDITEILAHHGWDGF